MEEKRGRSWLIWLVVLILLGAGGWFGWRYWEASHNKKPEYRTAEVTRGNVTQSVTASGQLNPVLSVEVGSQISGIIQNLYADFNTIVTQGMVIARLDPATYLSAVHQAEGDLANAKAAQELTRVEAKRAEELKAGNLISSSDFDKSIADLHQAEAQITIKQATLERAQVDLARCTIAAPTNGIVISRHVDVGQTVAASLSAPVLFTIANDLSKMQIDAMVSEADVGGVETNQSVDFTVDAFPNRTFHGTVIQIRNAPITNQNVVSYDTVVSVDNPDQKLKPGMTANVSIVIAERENVLKVPNAAFRFKPPEPETKSGPKQMANAQSGASAPSPAAGAGMRGEGRPGGSDGAAPSGGGPGPGGGARNWGEGGRRGPGGGGPGGGAPGMARRSRGDRSPTRTVYVMVGGVEGEAPKLEPRQVKIGISDGTSSEVIDGVKEGETVVVGQIMSGPLPASGASNPFGGPRRF
ncbi:MAG TPA: efflux RND transporter periplasmic adaptor subunit [Verrucomicrobiae bacterium]